MLHYKEIQNPNNEPLKYLQAHTWSKFPVTDNDKCKNGNDSDVLEQLGGGEEIEYFIEVRAAMLGG